MSVYNRAILLALISIHTSLIYDSYYLFVLFFFFLLIFFFSFFFFFSSRRRHTRLTCDWSSDVCSSDLAESRWHHFPQRHSALEYHRRREGLSPAHPQRARDAFAATRFVRSLPEIEIGRASCRERV